MPNYGGSQTQVNHSGGPYTVPIGTVFAWSGTGGAAIPTGYILCDGAPYLRATYPALFAVIGSGHGDGTKTNTGASSGLLAANAFNAPDQRGRLQRGIDNMGGPSGARGFDDVATNPRFAANTGGSAAGVGSKESDQFQGHWHNMYAQIELNGSDHGTGSGIGSPTVDMGTQGRDIVTDPSYGAPQVGNETRSANIAVVFIIKAF